MTHTQTISNIRYGWIKEQLPDMHVVWTHKLDIAVLVAVALIGMAGAVQAYRMGWFSDIVVVE